MATFDQIKKGTTHRIFAQWAQTTGLTPTVSIWRQSDSKYLKSDATWVTPESTLYTMTAVDATDRPGLYYFDFAIPDLSTNFLIELDGTSSHASSSRYQIGQIESVADSPTNMHWLRAFITNKKSMAIATGIITVYDDDGTTTLFTIDPTSSTSTNFITLVS